MKPYATTRAIWLGTAAMAASNAQVIQVNQSAYEIIVRQTSQLIFGRDPTAR